MDTHVLKPDYLINVCQGLFQEKRIIFTIFNMLSSSYSCNSLDHKCEFPIWIQMLVIFMLKIWQELPGVMLITNILYVFQILFGNTCRLGCVYEALYQKLCKKLEYCFIFLVTHLIERCHHETQLSTQTKVIFILHLMR